jgi:hypothetical protein
MQLFKNFKTEDSGNVGMMFSVSLVAIVTAIGVAFDYGQMSKAKVVLQSQVDAAVLAASSVGVEDWDISVSDESAGRREVALQVMSGNGYDMSGAEPTFTMTANNTILGRAEMEYQTMFGGFIGKDKVKIVAESESGLGVQRSVHLALVLDNTLSMLPNGKMAALKTGSKNLIDSIEAGGGNSKVAIVPFARYVRIPPEEYTASWLDVPQEFDTEITWQQATHTGGTCQIETRTRIRDGVQEEYQTNVCTDQTTTYEQMSRTVESRFEGCVGTRLPPYSEMDGAYVHKVPGLLHLIHHQHSGSYNSNAWCARKLTPLTNDFDALEHEVNELYGTDQTYLPSGLLWGQAVLSPGAPFDNVDSDASIDKILVLMTDGQNSAQIQMGQEAEENYKAPPYIGTSENENEYSPEANLATARMCQNIKNEGIKIFTIAFQVDDTDTINLLRGCASDASMAFTPQNNAALIERFNHISGSLQGNARLIR